MQKLMSSLEENYKVYLACGIYLVKVNLLLHGFCYLMASKFICYFWKEFSSKE